MFDGGLEAADQAYPMLVREVLPDALVGFFAAVLFGAILSSFNSVLNSSVTLFGIDIYKQHINPGAAESTIVRNGKIFGLILAFLAMFVAPVLASAKSIFTYLQEVNVIYSIPILTIIVVGYTTKYVPAIAAKIGVISGSAMYILSQFILKPYYTAKAKAPLISDLKETFLEKTDMANSFSGVAADKLAMLKETINFDSITNDQIHNLGGLLNIDTSQLDSIVAGAYPHFLHVMAILFIANILIMLAIGKFYPRATAYELEYTEQVDIEPWKYVKHASIAVCVIVVAVYVYFS